MVGSAAINRVGRQTVNTPIFFFGPSTLGRITRPF